MGQGSLWVLVSVGSNHFGSMLGLLVQAHVCLHHRRPRTLSPHILNHVISPKPEKPNTRASNLMAQRLMVKILHYLKDPKLWELRYIPD